MSQAAQHAPAAADQPAPRTTRTRLLMATIGIVLLLLAIPGGAYAFSRNQLSQGQQFEAAGSYKQALSSYATVGTVAGNPASRVFLGDLADRAQTGTAETHFLWGVQLKLQGKFDDSEAQLRATVNSGIAGWTARGNAALADLFIAWGQSLVATQQFQAGIDKYNRVSAFDPTGNLSVSINAGLSAAYAGYAQWYTENQPPDYPNALIWYEKLIKDFPDSLDAQQAQASAFPQTLYNAALAFTAQLKYQQARDAMSELVQNFPTTTWGTQANAALHANQTLTGQLIVSDQNPTPVANRLVRIATHYQIVKAHTYQDSPPIYSTSTDAKGFFKVSMPPGENYLITWWDPSRSTFVTTFVTDTQPVNLITINPLEPAHTTVATS